MATILVVDDQAINRASLAALLAEGGHRLLEAADGAKALALATKLRPDLVITDILMPNIDAYEFVRKLRADPTVASTPVIFYTAHYLESAARRLASAFGGAHVLTKPSEPDVVLRTVTAALGVESSLTPAAEELNRDPMRQLTHLYDDAVRHAGELEMEINERKRAEEAVKEREERIRLLLDSTAEGIFGTDLQGHCTFANSSCARLLGYAGPDQLLGKNMHALIHHSRADGTPNPEKGWPIYQAVRQGKGSHVEGEILWRADGSSFLAEYWAYPVRRAGQIVGGVATFLDITERKSLEEQFRRVQKMEAIGRLAGGVCHDFNNLLTIINGYSDMLLATLPKGDPMQEFAEQVRRAGERAVTLTRQLLAFSRKQVLQPEVIELKALMADMGKMLRRLISEDIDLKFVSDPDLWRVKADPGQVEQVILNLCVNARDSMPQGGKLTIETHNFELDGNYAVTHPETPPGQYVLLAVSDTGCGMDAATQARIFEPFFTTKEAGKGTGLGLAIVHGIVKQSGGHIQVYSEPGVGTTFKIYLPREYRAVAGRKSHQGVVRTRRGTETVLLVEDDDGVRALARMILDKSGYRVLEARNGGEALLLCEQHKDSIQLLVSDVVMPQMGGEQLAERLASLQPAMKVLLMSGYTDDAILHHRSLETAMPFLPKPFSPDALTQKVREVLDESDSLTAGQTSFG